MKHTTAAEKVMTAKELTRTSVSGKVLELIRGHLVVEVLSPSDGAGAVLAKSATFWRRARGSPGWSIRGGARRASSAPTAAWT